MKLRIFPNYVSAINTATATATAVNSASGVWGEIALKEGETKNRYRLAPYGIYPVRQPDGRIIQQVVDREAAEAMANSFNSLVTKLATFFKGIPIYEGHADDAGWSRDNPGHKASAVGRIKKIEAGEDGIYVESVFNSRGVDLIGGDAPQYSGHSPHWRMVPIEGKPDHMRPVLLWSDALTNDPNIVDNVIALNSLGLGTKPEVPNPSPKSGDSQDEPENATNIMKLTPEALKALGFAPDATPTEAEISAALIKALAAKETEKTKAESSKSEEISALNTRIKTLEDAAKRTQSTETENAINAAIADGRIAEADRQRWSDALNTSFDSENAKLEKLIPTINTRSQLPDLSGRGGVDTANGIDAMNTATRAYAKEHNLNINTQEGFTQAWNGAKAAKPEIFASK